jgi:HSP20 family molecular chaperone IbpA
MYHEVDLLESQTDYHLRADLPGIPKENVDINCAHGYLIIRAEFFKYHMGKESDVVFHTR